MAKRAPRRGHHDPRAPIAGRAAGLAARHDPRAPLDTTSTTKGLKKKERTQEEIRAARKALSGVTPAADVEFMELAHARFDNEASATKSQRQRELDDLKFYAGDQWPDDVRAARAGQLALNGMPPVPARPCLTINKVKEPVRLVQNQQRQNEMGIEIAAADDFGEIVGPINDEEIIIREGIVRRIQRESNAVDARSWAADRATQAGRGFYAVMVRYVEGSKTFDQEVYIRKFYNQACVVMDPLHESAAGEDAEWEMAGSDLSWEEYESRYPNAPDGQSPNPVLAMDDDQFRALGDAYPAWFATDDEHVRTCRVVDYWYVVREVRELLELKDGTIAYRDEIKGDVPADAIVNSRYDVFRKIKWAQIDGVQRLDETDWPGPDMPIVKVLGEELQPYDKERRAEGMIRQARDAQQAFNAMVSKWVETVGLAPIPPFQATPDQIRGFEQWYFAANTRTLPYLPYNSISEGGELIPPPNRTPVDTPVTAIAGSIQVFAEGIQSTTGVSDPQLGKTDPSLRSGKAISALQQQSTQGTSNYMDNLKRSVRYEGQVINNLLYPIYGRPGRLIRMITGEGDPGIAIVGPTSPEMLQKFPQGQLPRQFQLTKDAKFNVVVNVTRSFDSRRQQEVSEIGELLSARPELLNWFGDIWFKNQDGPGHKEMAERARAMLDPKIQQMLAEKAKAAGKIPPEIVALITQMQERLQRAEGILDQAEQELQSKEQDNKTKLEVERLASIKEVHLQKMKDATSIAVAQIGAMTKGVLADNQNELEAIALAHESEMADLERQYGAALQLSGQAHERAVGERQHEQTLEAGQQAHAQTLEQNEQQAALAPPPTEGAE